MELRRRETIPIKINDMNYRILFTISLLILYSCGDDKCSISEVDDLRGTWLQTTNIHGTDDEVAVYYEFSPPSKFRPYYNDHSDTISPLSAFPSGRNLGMRLDEDQCILGWYQSRLPENPNFLEWHLLSLSDDQLEIDMFYRWKDSTVAESLILTKVK